MKGGEFKMLTKVEAIVILLMVIALILIIYEMGQGLNWTL
ncbi:hypothetical protein ABVS_3396 (plasmid) [Acinetobacter lwoffii]|jgi:hypothetical protein|nr:hypothetical protein ABVS_3396 [Acinetobacter lwoffii]